VRRNPWHARSALGVAHPEPIEPHIAPLQQAVTAGKYDAGFAADGDATASGPVDLRHVRKTTDFFFCVDLAGMRDLPGDIAKTFSVTKFDRQACSELGRKVHEVRSGSKYICCVMLDYRGGGKRGIGIHLTLPYADATVSALFSRGN